LPLGKIKISRGRGSGGHKGVESIIKELGTKNFVRFRIGITPSSKPCLAGRQVKTQSLEKFVLENFSQEEKKILKSILKKTCQALKTTLNQGLQKAMTEFNK
jgi:PTH1 family peptidyl-tRNA hydrolase